MSVLFRWIVSSHTRFLLSLGRLKILDFDLLSANGTFQSLACFVENERLWLNDEVFLDLMNDFFGRAVLSESVEDVLLIAMPLFDQHIQSLIKNASG